MNLKHIVLVFAVALGLSSAAFGQAKISFEKEKHNFGTILEAGGPQSYEFKFTNTGSTPLIIHAVNASCGCTTPTWTRKPVEPGQSGIIEVTYNPANRPGVFNKSITISSNATNAKQNIYISGEVEEKPQTMAEMYPREIGPVRAKTNYVRVGQVSNNETKEVALVVANDSDDAVRLEFRTPPEAISIRTEPAVIPAHSTGEILVTYDGAKAETFGNVVNRLYLLTDGKASYKNSIGVTATVVEDFSALSATELANAPVPTFDAVSHNFGTIMEGDKVEHTFMLTNSGKSNLIIRKITTSCGCTAVEPEKKVLAPGETTPLLVKFNSKGKLGRQLKTVKVITNSPSQQTTTLKIETTIKAK